MNFKVNSISDCSGYDSFLIQVCCMVKIPCEQNICKVTCASLVIFGIQLVWVLPFSQLLPYNMNIWRNTGTSAMILSYSLCLVHKWPINLPANFVPNCVSFVPLGAYAFCIVKQTCEQNIWQIAWVPWVDDLINFSADSISNCASLALFGPRHFAYWSDLVK